MLHGICALPAATMPKTQYEVVRWCTVFRDEMTISVEVRLEAKVAVGCQSHFHWPQASADRKGCRFSTVSRMDKDGVVAPFVWLDSDAFGAHDRCRAVSSFYFNFSSRPSCGSSRCSSSSAIWRQRSAASLIFAAFQRNCDASACLRSRSAIVRSIRTSMVCDCAVQQS